MRLEKESAMTAFLISLFQTLQSIFNHSPASVASVSPCAIIYVKSRSQNKLPLWRENVGECPANPPVSPRLKRQGNETIVKSPHSGAIKDGENWLNIPACPRLSPRWGGGGGSNDWCITLTFVGCYSGCFETTINNFGMRDTRQLSAVFNVLKYV